MNTPRTRFWAAGLIVGALATATMLIGAAPASARGFTVQATPDVTTVEMGQRITITGAISPGKKGQRVTAEQLTGGQWESIKNGFTGAKGAYTLSVLPTQPGAVSMRVSTKALNGKTLGSSAPFDVAALQWHLLSDVQAVSGKYCSYAIRISGASYPHSSAVCSVGETFATPQPSVEIDLRRQCTAFKATLGISDTNPSNSVAQVDVVADGATLLSQTVAFGQSVPVALPLNDHLRLKLTTVGLQGRREGAAFGDAQILCAF